jgi:DNA polymerase
VPQSQPDFSSIESLNWFFRGLGDLPIIGDAARGAQLAGEKSHQAALDAVALEYQNCTACSLHIGRSKLVHGRGSSTAHLFVVLAPPSAREDSSGISANAEEPAGQLLQKMLLAIGVKPEAAYFANVVRCRPPRNRRPQSAEVDRCSDYLLREIRIVAPRAILAFGEESAQMLSRSEASIAHLRGHWHEHEGIPVMPSWHPEDLLEHPERKREAWEDLQKLRARLQEQ